MADLNLAPVFVSGVGTTSSLGVGTTTALEGLRAGARGIAPPCRSEHLRFHTGQHPLVGEVPLDVPLEQRFPTMIQVALDEALSMAGPPAGTTGIFLGTTAGIFVGCEIETHRLREEDPMALAGFGVRGPGALAEWVAERVGARGPILTFSMACTSSAAAMASAADHLRAGTCERAVVVGMDPLSTLTVQGFRSLMLVDPSPSRPFDRTRKGLQLGEGCGVLVLDKTEGPFRVLGSANWLDTTHMTASATDGSTAEAVITEAIRRSGLHADQIATIKAHGTGTLDNDLAEGRGIARTFGSSPPPFASLKGALGHTLGAAGALETALWLGALKAGFVPASVGFTELDPDIGVAPSTRVLPAPRGAHLFSAFGFGGSCVSLVVADA